MPAYAYAEGMSQLHRFYLPTLADHADIARLPEDELHHALHVVRLRSGDRIRLFDGDGVYADAQVTAATKRDLELEIGPLHRDPQPTVRLTLAQAWLNHAHATETLIRRGTELGVDEFLFFKAEHSEKSPKESDKWLRMAIESCKQCGRNRLPIFRSAKSIDDILAARPPRLIVATQAVQAKAAREIVGDARDVLLLIGPEGDFSARELAALFEAGAHPLSLGPLTLRAEVAGTTAIAIIQYHLGRLGPIPT